MQEDNQQAEKVFAWVIAQITFPVQFYSLVAKSSLSILNQCTARHQHISR